MQSSAAAGRAAGDSVEPQRLVVGPQPVVVEAEHVVQRPHLLPLAQAEDPVGVAAVPAHPVQLRRRLPLLGQELVCRAGEARISRAPGCLWDQSLRPVSKQDPEKTINGKSTAFTIAGRYFQLTFIKNILMLRVVTRNEKSHHHTQKCV